MPKKDSQLKTGDRIFLWSVMCIGVILVVAIALTSERVLPRGALGLTLGAALLFNVTSVGGRWIVTKNGRQIYLIGRYPLVLGTVRLACFAAVVFLMLLALSGVLVGGDFGRFSLLAFVHGMVAAGGLGLFTTGLMNALIIARHFQGTLAATSREGR